MHKLDRNELNGGRSLPEYYGSNRLTLLPRDPYWLFAYWEVTPALVQSLGELNGGLSRSRRVLRVRDRDRGVFRDIEVGNHTTGSWHIPVETAGNSYAAELGELLPDGRFVTLLVSNTVRTPRDSISPVIDPRWRLFAFWQHRHFHQMVTGLSSYELFMETERLGNEGVYRD